MKQLRILAAMALMVVTACNTTRTSDTSRNSLDWAGEYAGIVPCADCEGILTTLTLNTDNTYRLRTRYLGKSSEDLERTGGFSWNKAGNRIELQNVPDGSGPRYFHVGENRLTQLDLQGKVVTGDLAASYILAKNKDGIVNKYWKLVEVNGSPVMPNEKWKKEPHMILHMNGRVTGNGGCNGFSGSYELSDNNRIRFSAVAATKMMCMDIMQHEDLMFRALSNTDSYLLTGDTLQLIRARMAPLARFTVVYLR